MTCGPAPLFSLPLQLCHIDCQAEGGIPSYSFALMVIFFLQQRREPLLPVYLGPWVTGSAPFPPPGGVGVSSPESFAVRSRASS